MFGRREVKHRMDEKACISGEGFSVFEYDIQIIRNPVFFFLYKTRIQKSIGDNGKKSPAAFAQRVKISLGRLLS